MYPETILPITAHIPHTGTGIPDAVRDQFIPWPGELWREIAMVTDWYTDELFGLPGIAATQTPINRVVVDLERYSDDSLEGLSRRNPGTRRGCGGDERWRLCHVC
jgi:N-formylglutamate amidohydrolase